MDTENMMNTLRRFGRIYGGVLALAMIGAIVSAMPSEAAPPPSPILNCQFNGGDMGHIASLKTFPKDGGDPGFKLAAGSKSDMDSPFADINIVEVRVFALNADTCNGPAEIRLQLRVSAKPSSDKTIQNARVFCGLYAPSPAGSGENVKLDTMTFQFYFPDVRPGELGLSVPFTGRAGAGKPADGSASLRRTGSSPAHIDVGAEFTANQASAVHPTIRYKIAAPGDKERDKFPSFHPVKNGTSFYDFGMSAKMDAKIVALDAGAIGNIPADTPLQFTDTKALGSVSITRDKPFAHGADLGADDFGTFSPSGQATSSFFVKDAHLGNCSVRIDE